MLAVGEGRVFGWCWDRRLERLWSKATSLLLGGQEGSLNEIDGGSKGHGNFGGKPC
jgi:hypothetical protein